MKRFSLLAIVLIATLSAAARPMTFEDLAGFQRIGTPALSPDGRWIAYDVSSVSLPKNASTRAVWLMKADGSGAKEIAAAASPVWSPDGKTIAMLAGSQIALYDVATAKSKTLPAIAGGAGSLKWTPDGTALLAVSDVYPDCGVEEKCIAEKEQSAKDAPSKARVIDSLLFRHWNTWVAPTRSHILLVPVSGGRPRDLTPGKFNAPPFSVGGGDEFDISPDGKELVFARNTDEKAERSTNADLFVVPVSGGEATRITSRGGADTGPVFSPDGRWIAWRSQARAGFEADQWELWLYDRDTKQSRRIAADFPHWVDSITWSPDSRSIFASVPLEARTAIYEISLDGRAHLVHNAGSAGGVSVAPDGKSLYFQMSTLSRPADIYAMTKGGTARRLTTHNDAQLAALTMGAYESITWTGADNARVQGWLIRPPNFDAAKKYPAVVLIHGGPQGAWGESWSYRWNPQMFAARGYVVLMPNPRGSTGFGQKFVDEISRDWNGKVLTDIMNGVDVFAALPYVDATRMGAAGASYGGYMVNWLLGHTTRFKAFVSHAGVYNLESMYGVTEELWFPEWEFGGPPWEQQEIYDRMSPHRSVKNFATPTLVTHGELDFRVPVGEAMQLFTALQRRDVPSRLVLFPDEGHWILKPQNSKLWHQQVLDWLDRWLK